MTQLVESGTRTRLLSGDYKDNTIACAKQVGIYEHAQTTASRNGQGLKEHEFVKSGE